MTNYGGTLLEWHATWPGLLKQLRTRLRVCLAPEQRIKYLAETESEAWTAFAVCERRHGREPVPGLT